MQQINDSRPQPFLEERASLFGAMNSSSLATIRRWLLFPAW
jgi:hypothetical protein